MQTLDPTLIEKIREALAAIENLPSLENLKAQYLGPKGVIRNAMKSMAQLSAEERPAFGKKINAIRESIESLFINKATELANHALLEKYGAPVDITLNSRDNLRGNLHPLTKVRKMLEDIFHDIGFATVDGPEIETEWYCFDALNTPPTHPARDVMDTFFLPDDYQVVTTNKHGNERYLLRSHTSTVQIRTMLNQKKPPIRIIAPGRTFRRDTVDATHSANFHQIEALYVDKNVTVCDLKATLNYFLRSLFGKNTEIRLRPSFFPFTEPSFEVDFRSPNLGKLSDQWIEILGCGMVDPNVFENVDIDASTYTGFAIGCGIERLAMLLYGIDDVRLFYQNDLRFLDQF